MLGVGHASKKQAAPLPVPYSLYYAPGPASRGALKQICLQVECKVALLGPCTAVNAVFIQGPAHVLP